MQKTTSIFLLLFFSSLSLFSQWIKLNGPYGAVISTFASVNGSKIYCNPSGSGFYATIDTGKTWQKEFTSLFQYGVGYVTSGEGKLITVTSGSGHPTKCFMSLDSGATFNPLIATFADTIPPYSPLIKIYPSGIYGATTSGFYKSPDNGQTWTPIHNNLPDSSQIADFIVYGNNKIMLISFDSIYFSDNGSPWIARVIDSTVFAFTRKFQESDGTVYTTTDYGIYRSYDDGITWTDISANIGNTNFGQFRLIDSAIYLYLGDEIWKSDTTVINWINTGLITPSTGKEVADVYRSGDVFLAATFKGIYRGDTSFVAPGVASNTGIESYLPEAIFADSQLVHVGQSAGYFISTDGGSTFTEPAEPTGATNIKKFGNTIFMCRSSELWQSVAGSQSFSLLNSVYAWDITKTTSGDLFVASFGNGVYKSTDNGITFNQVNNGLTDLNMFSILSIGNNIIAGNYFDGIYLSTDLGASWTLTAASGYAVFDLVQHNNLIFAQVLGLDLLVSADSGFSWQPAPLSNLGGNNAYILSNGNQLFQISVQNSIFEIAYMSLDNGLSWIDLSSFFSSQIHDFTSAHVTADMLYVATINKGIWKIPIPVLLNNVEIQNQKSLISIFPNPAKNSFVIQTKNYNRPIPVAIYDITGRNILQFNITSGNHSVNISNFNKGIYCISINNEMKKLAVD